MSLFSICKQREVVKQGCFQGKKLKSTVNPINVFLAQDSLNKLWNLPVLPKVHIQCLGDLFPDRSKDGVSDPPRQRKARGHWSLIFQPPTSPNAAEGRGAFFEKPNLDKNRLSFSIGLSFFFRQSPKVDSTIGLQQPLLRPYGLIPPSGGGSIELKTEALYGESGFGDTPFFDWKDLRARRYFDFSNNF